MQPNMMNPAMRNGLILGVLFSTNFFLTVSGVPALALFSYLVTGLIIYFTHRFTVQFRDVDSGGSISFGRAYGFVLLQYIFATIISSFTKYFFLRFSKSTFLEDMYNQNMITLEQFLPTVTGEMYDDGSADKCPRVHNYGSLDQSALGTDPWFDYCGNGKT